MNDLSETITNYITVRNLLRDNTENPKIIKTAIDLFDHYIDLQDTAFVKAWDKVVGNKLESFMPPWGHSDLEYNPDPAFTECSKEQIYKNYRASIDEYNKLQEKYEALLCDHAHIQDLFYEIDVEYDELKVNYERQQKNYHIVVSKLMSEVRDD